MMEPEAGGAPNAQTGATRKTTVIEAHYRIVTPMFCSGADQQKAELRLSSFKGALRFWWRTLQWRTTQSHEEVWRREAELFGSSEQRHGQSKVRIRLTSKALGATCQTNSVFEGGRLKGAHYLAYGVITPFGANAGRLLRPMIPGGEFSVRLMLHPKISAEQVQEVADALILLGTVGGMGAKSRKGFGSLTLTKLEVAGEVRKLNTDPGERLKGVLGPVARLQGGLPDWTAWSRTSRIVTASSGTTSSTKLLDELGKEFVLYRSWGTSFGGSVHQVLGNIQSEKNFVDDHDLYKWSTNDPSYPTQPGINYPVRVAFGLPHNYGRGEAAQVRPPRLTRDRRASPLFFHVHQIDANSPPVGVIVFLPARFLHPDDVEIKSFGRVGANNGRVPFNPGANFWNPITDFMDRLTSNAMRNNNREPWVYAEEQHLA